MQQIQGQFDEQDIMNMEFFIEEIYEIAFGDNAINKDYSKKEVLKTLRMFSEKALMHDELKS